MSNTIPIINIIPCKDRYYDNMVNNIPNIISDEVIRLLGVNDINGAIIESEFNISTKDTIIVNITHRLTQQLEYLEDKIYWITDDITEDEQRNIEHQIDDLKDKINCIISRIDIEDKRCVICLSEFVKPTVIDCCQNLFCFECISKSIVIAPHCPICRSKIAKENLRIIDDGTPIERNIQEVLEDFSKLDTIILNSINKTKQENLGRLLKHIKAIEKNHKIIIYCQNMYDNTYTTLIKTFSKEGIRFETVKKINVKKNDRIVKEYQNGDFVNAICIPSYVCNFLTMSDNTVNLCCDMKLNLCNTTDIIFCNLIPKKNENAVINYTKDPKREKTVRVWKIHTQYEIDRVYY